MRRVRYLRTPAGRLDDLPRPLRPAASGAGERGHRGRRGRPPASDPGHGVRGRRFRRPDHRRPDRAGRDRPRAVLDVRGQPPRQRAADPHRLRPWPDRPLPQRQPRERQRAARRPGSARLDLPDQQRHRGHPAPLREVGGSDRGGRHRRIGVAGARRLLAGDADAGAPDRGARSPRLPPARPRTPRRRPRDQLRDVRPRPDRSQLRAGRRAGRGAGHRPRGSAVVPAVPGGSVRPLRVRARLLRPTRQLRVRAERQRGAHEPWPPAGARGGGRGRRGGADSRLGPVRRDGVRGAVHNPLEDGPHPQPLRRADLHPAAAVDPGVQGQDQAEHRAQHPRGAAGRARRRLHRARYDQPQDRVDDQGGGRGRGAHAHQLPADRGSLLLRHRHPAPRRADRRSPEHRRDPRLHGRRHARLSQHGRVAGSGREAQRQLLHRVLQQGLPGAPPRDERAYMQMALKMQGGDSRSQDP